MREGWVETTLGELLKRSDVRQGSGPAGRVLTVSEQFGLVDQEEHMGRRLATADTSKYKVVNEGDIVYNVYLLWKGAIGQSSFSETCVTSPVYEVFRPIGVVSPRILGMILRSGFLRRDFDEISIGSIERRRRAPWKQFLEVKVALPPLHEQRRIVDLMDSVDAAVNAAQAEVETATNSRRTVFDGLVAAKGVELEWKPLGETGTFRRGRRFTKADYVESGLPCIHYGQIHTDLGLRTFRSLTHLPESMSEKMRLAQPGDLVFAATSEDVDDLGKATVWLGGRPAAVHDDCQIFQHGMDPVFAAHLVDSFEFHRQKVVFAAGTKVTRISGNDLAKIVLPIPDRGTQCTIGQIMGLHDDAITAATAALDRLRSLRSSLLTCLLSGQHEIPESYDRFL